MEILNDIIRGLVGVVGLLVVAYALSTDRKRIHWPVVIGGVALQLIIASLFFLASGVGAILQEVANLFVTMIKFTEAGSREIFGPVLSSTGETAKIFGDKRGFIFAFQVLPTIIFFSALASLLYYVGLLQRIVFGLAWLMKRLMRLSGAESLAAAANVFVGQTEAPSS